MKIGCFTRFPIKCMILLFYTISIVIVIVLTAKHKRVGKKIQKIFVKKVGDLALWSILDSSRYFESCELDRYRLPYSENIPTCYCVKGSDQECSNRWHHCQGYSVSVHLEIKLRRTEGYHGEDSAQSQ